MLLCSVNVNLWGRIKMEEALEGIERYRCRPAAASTRGIKMEEALEGIERGPTCRALRGDAGRFLVSPLVALARVASPVSWLATERPLSTFSPYRPWHVS